MCTRKQQGFTLTELLIVMAIAAIMATIALPNM
ncbi:prepilin-type N-terminal cleavage/methylation domain-containing protein, partial [Neisseria gonorrhoeae]